VKTPVRWPNLVLCLAVAALLTAGCSRAPQGIVPVSGRVRLGGQPLAGAVITFQPVSESAEADAAGGSFGHTDAEGRFTLRLVEPNVPGAAVGRHMVTITTSAISPGDESRPSGERVPVSWRNGSQTFDVPAEGTSAANFDLP
jgi:hypothetical protein